MSGLVGSRDIAICNPRGAKLDLHDIIWHPEGRPSILTTILTWPLGPFILVHLFWFILRHLVDHSIYCPLADCILSVVGFIQSPIAHPSSSISANWLVSSLYLVGFVGVSLLQDKYRIDMSSNAGQNPPPSKAVNIPNTVSSTPFHSAALADNSSSQRRVGGPASSRPGVSSKTSATPRNNQARKSQHNRQRKPRLLDDDEYNESVGSQVYLPQELPADPGGVILYRPP